MKIWCNYRPRPRGSVISRTISSANCIEWPSFRQSDETETPLLSFGKKKVSKENLFTASLTLAGKEKVGKKHVLSEVEGKTWLPLAHARGVLENRDRQRSEAARTEADRPKCSVGCRDEVPAFGYFSFPKEK